MTDVVPYPSPLPQLATPGERLGWIFNDRNLYRRRYLEPPPQPSQVSPHLHERLMRAQRGMAKRILLSLGAGVGLALLISCCGGAASVGDSGSGAGVVVAFLAFVALIGGVAGAVLAGVAPSTARKAIENAQQQAQHEYAQAYAAWDSRRQGHEQQQQHRYTAVRSPGETVGIQAATVRRWLDADLSDAGVRQNVALGMQAPGALERAVGSTFEAEDWAVRLGTVLTENFAACHWPSRFLVPFEAADGPPVR